MDKIEFEFMFGISSREDTEHKLLLLNIPMSAVNIITAYWQFCKL